MRAIRFLPLVFIVGIDGFAMFAPYVAFVMSVAYVYAALKARPQPQPIPVEVDAEPIRI